MLQSFVSPLMLDESTKTSRTTKFRPDEILKNNNLNTRKCNKQTPKFHQKFESGLKKK